MAKKISWQQRAAEHRKAAVLNVDNRPDGESIQKACRRVAAKYNGRCLPGGKRLSMSKHTLCRIYRRWKCDESDAAFDFKYNPHKPSVIHPWIGHLLAEYAIHHGLNIPQAHQRLASSGHDLPIHNRTMRRHISVADQQRIAKAVKLHRRQRLLDKEKTKLTGGKP